MRPKFGRDDVELAVVVGQVLDVADLEADREPGLPRRPRAPSRPSARELSSAEPPRRLPAPRAARPRRWRCRDRASASPGLRLEPLDQLVVRSGRAPWQAARRSLRSRDPSPRRSLRGRHDRQHTDRDGELSSTRPPGGGSRGRAARAAAAARRRSTASSARSRSSAPAARCGSRSRQTASLRSSSSARPARARRRWRGSSPG